MHFDRAQSVYGTLSASLSQNGCSHNTLQQQSPDVHRSNPRWVLKTVEANRPHETYPTSLLPLQPAQCPLERWEIFMSHSVYFSLPNIIRPNYVQWLTQTLGMAVKILCTSARISAFSSHTVNLELVTRLKRISSIQVS